MADMNVDLWKRVDELRGRMPIRELAKIANISEASLQTTRSLKTQPKLQMLYPIAKALGTTIEYLYAGEKEDWEDNIVFRKIASSQQLIDIATALCHAEPWELEAVSRMLDIKKGTSSTTASGIA